MSKLPNHPTKYQVYEIISKSTSFGNLGLFIGAGFSKAVLNDSSIDVALSWSKLLRVCSDKFDIEYDTLWNEGVSYPEIASKLCQKLSEQKEISYEESLRLLKIEIANLTSWYPNKVMRVEFSEYLNILSPSWIITTNYDLVIEGLLTGKAVPLGPNDPLVSSRGTIPVYHLHGIRINPDEIIISQEDYVSLFRPNEYRQIKLALTISESTTLLLGYGLGDVNVLTALDWSQNVFTREHETGKFESYPNEVIQVVRVSKPKGSPYRDKHGIVILETKDLRDFFYEYDTIRKDLLKEESEQRKNLLKLARDLDNPKERYIEKFIDDQELRIRMLKKISRFPIYLISGFVSFLHKCIDETWERSKPDGAFEGYNENLCMILDILTTFSFSNIPPALFETTAFALQRVGHYIGRESGQSWSAYETWQKRKNELSDEMIKELMNLANQYGYTHVKELMSEIVAS